MAPGHERLIEHAQATWDALDADEHESVRELCRLITAKCSDFPSEVAHCALMQLACEELQP